MRARVWGGFGLGPGHALGDAEIEDFRDHALRNQNVIWFQVAVNETRGMGRR